MGRFARLLRGPLAGGWAVGWVVAAMIGGLDLETALVQGILIGGTMFLIGAVLSGFTAHPGARSGSPLTLVVTGPKGYDEHRIFVKSEAQAVRIGFSHLPKSATAGADTSVAFYRGHEELGGDPAADDHRLMGYLVYNPAKGGHQFVQPLSA